MDTAYGKYRPLEADEVEKSRALHGENKLSEKKMKGFFSQFISNFTDPIIKILLAALGLNLILMYSQDNRFETLGIVAAILVSTLVSTVSEYGSELAFRRLKEENSKGECRVERKGGTVSLPCGELVVGDIVYLTAGERVPADGTMISGSLYADQSTLNGETKEVHKTPDGEPAPGVEAGNMLFCGSVITDGEGIMRVSAVGDKTFYGALAREVQEDAGQSPLRERLRALASSVSRIGYACAALVMLADIIFSFAKGEMYGSWHAVASQLIHAVTLGITVVVMAAPEGLPMMITLVLSRNMLKMQKDNVMVKKLVGIETAGSMNILFADKTGTLTEGIMNTSVICTGDGKNYRKSSSLPDEIKRNTALCAIYCCSCRKEGQKAAGGNSTDRAFMQFFIDGGTLDGFKAETVAKLPFSSVYKYTSITLRTSDGECFTIIKGAPDVLLRFCSDMMLPDGSRVPIDRFETDKKLKSMAEKAMRVLAIVRSDTPLYESRDFSDLCLIAFAGLRDELRQKTAKTIKNMHEAGIQVVMMTGDSRDTAVAIAKECGLLGVRYQSDSVMTGSEIAEMPDEELKKRLPHLRVIARALPSDKSRLVRISQESGLVCGMTGDGVNDAPALKKADVGFAMGNGTEVAKEAGDIVILDGNLASIAKAVLYGRTIFRNIRKFIVFQLTMNLAACGLSVICPLLSVETPITVMQMLWVNMIMDTLAGLAFAGECASERIMKEPPKSRGEKILSKEMCSQILFCGIYMMVLCLCLLKLPLFNEVYRYSDDGAELMTGFFTLFIFCGVFNSFNARADGLHFLRGISKNIAFVIIFLSISAIQLFMAKKGSSIFRCVPLTSDELKFTVRLALSVIPFDIIRRVISRLDPKKS